MFTQEEKDIIEHGKQNGKSALEVKQALAKYRAQTGYQQPQATPAPQPSTIGSRVSSVIQNAGSNVSDAISGDGKYAGESSVRRGVEATAEAFKAVPGVAMATAPEPVRSVLGTVGKGLGAAFSKLTDMIGSNKQLQNWVMEHPDAAKAIEEVAGTAKAGGEIAGTILLADQAAKGLQAGADKISAGTGKVTEVAKQTLDDSIVAARKLKENVQLTLAKKNVNPQLEASAERLTATKSQDPRFLQGTADRLDDPVTTYDAYLNQSKKALTDIKVDPAISQVGEKMGDAFKVVVKQRRDVGAVMGEELKKVGGIKTNILDSQDDFVAQLKDNGIIFDKVAKTIKQTGNQSKIAAGDARLIETYATELQKLGSKPTIGELDAFISRMSDDLNLYKASNGIIGTTNGERIVKGSLAGLRKQFDPAVTGNASLAGYARARETYAQLSDFIDDGAGYLGKMTQSGDFAKDASIAKSAVQSILNNGKKDWMLKLEHLTGYQATDDAVLALQAMKDAGDFRGLSLLETMADGSIPTSAGGISQRIIDMGIKQGAKIVTGSPEQQTRAILNSLSKQSSVNTAVNNHFTSAQQIIQNTPADKLASMGGMPKLLERTKINIVDGLKGEGLTQAAGAVSKLSTGTFKTLDAFKEAVMKALAVK